MPIAPGSAGGLTANNSNLSSVAGTGVESAADADAAATAATAAEIASTKRLANTTASLPIVYGSIAFYLGKKADELQTHEWTLFLRGPNQHDDHLNSLVIEKVVFQLHPSFAQPTRELTEPPYEVTERGWGEFEAQIRIHWKDPSEQTTIVNHTIKLYPQGVPPATGSAKSDIPQQSTEKPVLAETYDEVVFTEPTESFFRSLTQITAVPPETTSNNSNNETTRGDDKRSRSAANSTSKASSSSSWKDHLNIGYSDQEEFLALIAAQKFLQDELAGVKQRFQMVTDEISIVDKKVLAVQQQKQREAAAAAVRGSGTSGGASGERKRTKKSRSTSQNKRARTTTSSSNSGTKSAGAGGSTTSATASGKRAAAVASAVNWSRAGGTAKAAAGKAAAAASAVTAAAAANKKGSSNSQASSGTKK